MNTAEFLRLARREVRERVDRGVANPEDVGWLARERERRMESRKGRWTVKSVPSEPILRICIPGHRAAIMAGHVGRKPTVLRVGMDLREEIAARWPILVEDARALPPPKDGGHRNSKNEGFLDEYRVALA
jgi:hypothetical protein